MNLCVIPARGGSKRIPRKNIKEFCGKPMIAWSIEAAINSKCFDRIIVSTDDEEIGSVAERFGAEIPFWRPAQLSGDYTGTTAVLAHAIDWQNTHGEEAVNVCCLYATAPFVTPDNLVEGLNLLTAADADYAFSVTSYGFPIQRAIRITSGNRVEMFQPEHFNTRSQDLEEAWHDAGQFYWGKSSAWLENKSVFDLSSVPLILSRHQAQDIDTPEDWERAQLMFDVRRSKKVQCTE